MTEVDAPGPGAPRAGGTLHVVIARTPGQEPGTPAPKRVAAQRAAAREALREAAALAGCPDTAFEKSGPRGRPLPTASGWRWTITHDATLVAGAVWPDADVGIDVERIALRRRDLVERVSTPEERALFGEGAEPLDALGFSRLWTAKEAVLKAERIGLPGMPRCRVVDVVGSSLVVAEYEGRRREVLQTRLGGSLISACVLSATPGRVAWHASAASQPTVGSSARRG